MSALSKIAVLFAFAASPALPQSTTLIEDAALKEIIDESSGEMGLRYFEQLLTCSGYAPSLGAEQTARYLAERSREYGLSDVGIEEFPSDGKRFVWAFRTEPWWEGRKAELWLVEPERERLASFDVHRIHLARFSSSAQVTGELVDVGPGTDASHYSGKDVTGKIVLASGRLGMVHQRAVWERGAVGVVFYRTSDSVDHPDLINSISIEPFEGPKGETPAFAFSLSYRTGRRLVERLRSGEKLVVQAEVDAEMKAGSYPLVQAVVRGTSLELPELWILAHTNHRNTGGGNNLTGVGATLDMARTLATLIKEGKLARPRRSIRFLWGAEHIVTLYYLHEHPEAVSSILALLNLDMVGDHQVLSESILRLYRTPHSLPSFINDVIQEMFEVTAAGNSYSLVTGRLLDLSSDFSLPIVERSGSRDPFYYKIEPFWGPSDHEDVAEASLRIPAVLLNTWPDPYIATQEDSVARADATQMKRATVIAAASAFILASAGPEEIPSLTQNALGHARARLSREERRAASLVEKASKTSAAESFRQADNVVRQAYRREANALRTLEVFAEDGPSLDYLNATVADLLSGETDAVKRLRDLVDTLAEMRGWGSVVVAETPEDDASRLVPVRTSLIRGPVNFFRAQYGRDWMTQKLGDPDFAGKVRLVRLGHYYLYETLNFANGKRNLCEIRELVAAEYGPAPIDEIAEYFRLLEKAGIVTFEKALEKAETYHTITGVSGRARAHP